MRHVPLAEAAYFSPNSVDLGHFGGDFEQREQNLDQCRPMFSDYQTIVETGPTLAQVD